MSQRSYERAQHTRRQLTRRFGAAAGVFIAAPLLIREAMAQVAFSDDPFQLGIASGEAAGNGFVIWTSLAPKPFEICFGLPSQPVEVEWEVATEDAFRNIVRADKAIANPMMAHSVHVELDGLSPARPYWYRFRAGGVQSPVGRAKTTPMPSASTARATFAVAGCQHFESDLYTAYRHLAAAEPDFVFCYGDYIYENGGGALQPLRLRL